MIRRLRPAVLLAFALGASTAACEERVYTVPLHLEIECVGCANGDEGACNDGRDNDKDGLTDCEDPDCAGAYACRARGPENTVERCLDGIDNDGNGFTDCEDFSCRPTAACRTEVKGPEGDDETCSDGLDNDWNGFIDCDDFACSRAPGVTVCEGNDVTCSDGKDNDGNGFTDCEDFSCSRNDRVTVCN